MKHLKDILYPSVCVVLFLLFRLFSIKKSVVFISFYGKQYSDNPKAISVKMHEMRPDIQQYWVFNDSTAHDLPDYIRPLKGVFQKVFAFATSRYWVANQVLPRFYFKRKKQFLIQTWHGDIGFKKIGLDTKINTRKECHDFPFDYIVTGSSFAEEYYRIAFDYCGNYLKTGMPRNDILVSGDIASLKAIRRKSGIPDKTHILLYAPTFRDSKRDDCSKSPLPFDATALLDLLEKKTKLIWALIVRCHSEVNSSFDLRDDPRVIDASHYDDMSELMAISDILITDYSSCGCDFVLSGRETVLYRYDEEEYTKTDRDIFDVEKSVPFRVAKNSDELIKAVVGAFINPNRLLKPLLIKHFGVYGIGDASKRVVEFMLQHM